MKIMLDAGHGFSTTGKRSPSGMKEYEFNRAVASYAKSELEAYEQVSIHFAHSDQREVPLKERTDTANRLGVDVYVAIHANAYSTTWNDVRGIETFVYTTKPKEAFDLANKVQYHLLAMTGLKNRGVKTADFHVLRETHMTAILIECGFMTNREEEVLLRSSDYRRTCANAIVQALAEFYKLKKKQPATALQSSRQLYRLQAGAFKDRRKAELLLSRIEKEGFEAFITIGNDHMYHVQTGAFSSQENATEMAKKLNAEGFEIFIKED